MGPTNDASHEHSGDDRGAVETGRRRLALVALVVLGEGLALLAFSVFLVVGLLTEEADDVRNAVIETVAFAVLGALLLALAWFTLRARRWSRGPVITTQLLALPGVAVPLLQGDLWYTRWIGIPLALGSAAAIVLMLTAPVVAALYADD